MDGSETAACTTDNELCQDYAKHWSEMRGFAVGLHYNRYKLISDTDLASVYDLMGAAPVWIGDEGADVINLKLIFYLLEIYFKLPMDSMLM